MFRKFPFFERFIFSKSLLFFEKICNFFEKSPFIGPTIQESNPANPAGLAPTVFVTEYSAKYSVCIGRSQYHSTMYYCGKLEMC